MNIEQVVAALTPDIYEKFKTAIELGKWPDGKLLTVEQKETCMQAVIAYEHKNMAESQRTGFIEDAECQSKSKKITGKNSEEKIKWT